MIFDGSTKPSLNPNMAVAIEKMRQDNTPDNRNLMINEMMRTGFLAPATMDPMPEVDENGQAKMTKDTKISFMNLKGQDGKSFLAAFTERAEIERWKKDDSMQTIMLTFDEMAHIVLTSKGELSGFAINPFHENIVLNSELIANLAQQKRAFEAKAKADAEKKNGTVFPSAEN